MFFALSLFLSPQAHSETLSLANGGDHLDARRPAPSESGGFSQPVPYWAGPGGPNPRSVLSRRYPERGGGGDADPQHRRRGKPRRLPGETRGDFPARRCPARFVIISRAIGATCTGLIEEHYGPKSVRIDTKSCNRGPMAGFVCVDPNLWPGSSNTGGATPASAGTRGAPGDPTRTRRPSGSRRPRPRLPLGAWERAAPV